MLTVRTFLPMARRILLGSVLVCSAVAGAGTAPRTLAAGARATHPAAPVTTSTVAYHLTAQVVSGTGAGPTIAGQVAGTLDSTGILTATLTLASGATAKVSGTLAAPAKLTVKGKVANLTLSGKLLDKKAGVWGGFVEETAGGSAGSWVLAPETQSVSFSLGAISDKTSKDKVTLAGQLELSLMDDGWGEGTFSFLDNGTVLQAQGRLANGNLTASIVWPGKGTVLLVGTAKPAVGVLKWTGTFVGPALNDGGTFIGEG